MKISERLNKNNVGILGGSFDPPHICHVLAAVLFLQEYPDSEVWVIPCFEHPFGKEFSADFKHRLAMTKAAFRKMSRIKVLDIEKRLGGTSYTVKTLKHLKKTYPKVKFHLILGSDSLAEMDKWKNSDWIKKNVNLFVIQRGGKVTNKPVLPPLSSTYIRKRIKNNLDFSRLVPARVRSYINKNKLYK